MITFGITVCDEEYEFRRLLDGLIPFLKKGEEIIVLADQGKVTTNIENLCCYLGIRLEYFGFQNNFSDFKNYLLSLVKTKYLFQLDADEQVTPTLLSGIRSILNTGLYDCIFVPRINIVYNHSQEDIKKFKWSKTGDWISYPDYQVRVFEANGDIKWHLPVHEEVEGYKRPFILETKDPEFFSLIHVKTIEKQRKQNEKYEKIL